MGRPIPNYNIEAERAQPAPPINTYTLTPEEITARYGPPVPRKKKYDASRIIDACTASGSPEEAAERLGMDVRRLKAELGMRGIKHDWGMEHERGEQAFHP